VRCDMLPCALARLRAVSC